MDSMDHDDAQFDRLAESFFERYRQGEDPSVEEYARRHPELAERIRDIFPTLILMEQAASSSEPESVAAALHPGEQLGELGDYRLVREIGRGGMGIVYEAVQQSLNRRVALKVLGQQALIDRSFLERFRREAEAAAALQHANIVPVFDVGEHHGVHYFAMQFVDGPSLDRVIDDLQSLAATVGGPPQRDDSTSALLASGGSAVASNSQLSNHYSGSRAAYMTAIARITMEAAGALAFAHQRGIIHRDIKPSNLLLDARGTVWVTDFGLAQVDNGADLTRTGDLVGTLRYLAPERFQGWSDPRSDVYSLGLTLYELLTLRAAFDESDRQRLVRQILEQEPPPPRKLDHRIPRDLETIALTAIAKSPDNRYPTAEALADDLKRFIADRPIRARRATRAERTWRWCRRNPALATASAAVALLMVTVAVVSTISALRLREQRDLAVDARNLADQRLVLATEARESADLEAEKARVEAVKADQINRFLQETLASASPTHLPRPDVTVRELLDQAARDVEDNLADQPEIVAELEDTIGKAYYGLGAYEDAERHLRAAIALRRETLGAQHPDLATSLFNLSNVLCDSRYAKDSDLFQAGLDYLREAVAIRRDALGADHSDTIESQFALSRLEFDSGNIDASQRAMMRVGAGLGLEMGLDALNDSMAQLGALWKAGQQEEALEFIDQTAAEWREKMRSEYVVAGAFQMLANARHNQQDYNAAEPLYRYAIEIYRREYPGGHPLLADALHFLAQTIKLAGDRDAAEPVYREALEMKRRLLPDNHRALAATLDAVGRYARLQGKLDEAELLYSQSLAIRRAQASENDPHLAATVNSLAQVATAKGEYAQAEELFREALAIRLIARGRVHRLTAWTMYDLAALLNEHLAGYAEAETLYRELLEIREKVYGATHENTTDVRRLLALLWTTCPDESVRDPAHAVELLKQAVAQNPSGVFDRQTLGFVHYRSGQYEACIRELERCHELQRGSLTSNRFYLAMAHRQLGHGDEALQEFRLGEEWLESHPDVRKYDALREEAIAVLGIEIDDTLAGKRNSAAGESDD